jgi:hypothetical protein
VKQLRPAWSGTRTAGLVLTATLVGVAPASGQNALGGGSALDGNLIDGRNRYNSPAAIPNYRGRNLLVTGNVAGGRGFRGTVGYGAEFDFRGATGSDDLFRERANSAFSAPSFITAGRTIALMRFGQYLNEFEYRKATRGATTENFNDLRYVADELDNRLNLDKIAISSTTSAIYDTVSESRIVGVLLGPEGQRYTAVASSVMGVQVVPLESQGSVIGLSTYDMARAIGDTRSGHATATIGQEFGGGFQNLLSTEARLNARTEPTTTRLEPEVSQGRLNDTTEASYLEILQRIAERKAGSGVGVESSPEILSGLDSQFAALREALTASTGVDGLTAGDASEDPADARLPGLPDELQPSLTPGLPNSAEAIAAIAEVLRHGQTLGHYASEDPTRFTELLNSAGQRLAAGEYFWAERYFDRALRFTPGHPLAIAGMGHAQIGAGLHVPAALTLRRLLTTNPELIDVRYERNLLPSLVRLDVAVDQLRDRIARVERDRRLRGFVLAYIGHQIDDPALVAEGLGLMDDEPLRALLEAVWLD